jgi:hypothetical protein
LVNHLLFRFFSAGVAELMIFHPVDTLAKRLMSNKSTSLNFNQIVFRNYAEAPIGKKFLSLFPGLGYAAGYKILQRIYKLSFFFPFFLVQKSRVY